MQRIAQVHRLHERLANGVQYKQFPVAPPNFLLCALPFGDIQKKTLIRRDISGCILNRDGGLQHCANLAVFAPHFEFEVRHRTMFLEQLLQPFAVRGVCVHRAGNISSQQFLASLKSRHAHHRIVEIEESSLRRRNKNAFLHAGHQRAILFFRALSLRDVLQDVHCAK